MGEDKATNMVGFRRRMTMDKREAKKAGFTMRVTVHCLVSKEGEI